MKEKLGKGFNVYLHPLRSSNKIDTFLHTKRQQKSNIAQASQKSLYSKPYVIKFYKIEVYEKLGVKHKNGSSM